MNKQEFLAMSLPYGLKVLRGDNITILKVSGVDIDCNSVLFTERNTTTYGNISHSKPILRPISEISILSNDLGFIPIVELAKISEPNLNWVTQGFSAVCNYKENIEYHFLFNREFMCFEFFMYFTDKSDFIDKKPDSQLALFQKLVEWHFDIAGLIEKGEAIDVNTLEINPYK